MTMELQDVSPDQFDENDRHAQRKAAAAGVVIADGEPDPLRHTVTVRNPLIPQPEPDADPLIPLRSRPSRSRSAENTAHPHRIEETHDGASAVADAPQIEGARLNERMTREELDVYAEELGFNPDDFSSKQELLDEIRANPSEKMTRAELDAIARGAGVSDPEDLANKGEVVAAIKKAK
jgi:hypothetical protein